MRRSRKSKASSADGSAGVKDDDTHNYVDDDNDDDDKDDDDKDDGDKDGDGDDDDDDDGSAGDKDDIMMTPLIVNFQFCRFKAL